MFYPSFLHIPSIAGAVIGILVGHSLWDWNHAIAILVALLIAGLGVWLSIWWGNRFFKSLKEESKKE